MNMLKKDWMPYVFLAVILSIMAIAYATDAKNQTNCTDMVQLLQDNCEPSNLP